MDLLHIRLFGTLDVRWGRVPLPPLPGQGARSLLMFLALEPGRRYRRDVLCGTLWGERSDVAARKALRNGLWRLRSALEDAAPGAADRALRVEGELVGLAEDRTRVDVRDFEDSTAILSRADGSEELADAEAERLAAAVDAYRGDLLDGVYEDWCLAPRERMRLAFLAALERLVRHFRDRGDLAAAVGRGRMLLRHDPLREHMHRELMALHCAMGDRPSALRQYEHCREVLREELDIEPMEETRALHDAIRAGSAPGYPTLRPRPRRRMSPSVERTLDGVLVELYAAAERLERLRLDGREDARDD